MNAASPIYIFTKVVFSKQSETRMLARLTNWHARVYPFLHQKQIMNGDSPIDISRDIMYVFFEDAS